MDIFSSKKQQTKKVPTFSKKNPMKKGLHWKILLVSFLALSIIVFAYNAYIFFQIKNEQVFQKDISSTRGTTSFNMEDLQSFIEAADAKTQQQEVLLNTPHGITDPSV